MVTKEEKDLYDKAWYQANRSRRKQQAAEHYQKNKAYYQKWAKQYYQDHKEHTKMKAKAWRKSNPDKVRAAGKNSMRRRNGANQEEIDRFEKECQEQNFLCKICDRPDIIKTKTQQLVFDHDHKTGKYRGAICHKCNTVLGLIDENLNILVRLAEYIQ